MILFQFHHWHKCLIETLHLPFSVLSMLGPALDSSPAPLLQHRIRKQERTEERDTMDFSENIYLGHGWPGGLLADRVLLCPGGRRREAAINILSVISILPALAAHHCTYNLPLTLPDDARLSPCFSQFPHFYQFWQSLSLSLLVGAALSPGHHVRPLGQEAVAGQVKSSPALPWLAPLPHNALPTLSNPLFTSLPSSSLASSSVTAHTQSNEPALSTI